MLRGERQFSTETPVQWEMYKRVIDGLTWVKTAVWFLTEFAEQMILLLSIFGSNLIV